MGCLHGGVIMSSIAVIDTSTLINLKNIKCSSLIDYLEYYLCTTIYVIQEIEKGREDTKNFYRQLESKNKIKHVKLSIEDLIEMARVPEHKKRISNAELSCFVKAKNFGCKTFCDDKRAINYAKRYIELGEIVGIIHLIKEAYIKGYIGDSEVLTYQNRLNKNKFKTQGDLLNEVAAEKLKLLIEGKAIS